MYWIFWKRITNKNNTKDESRYNSLNLKIDIHSSLNLMLSLFGLLLILSTQCWQIMVGMLNFYVNEP